MFRRKLPPQRSPFWWLRWVPTVIFLLLVLDLIYIIGRVAIVPVLASFALAYILNPLVTYFEKRGISRAIAAAAALIDSDAGGDGISHVYHTRPLGAKHLGGPESHDLHDA